MNRRVLLLVAPVLVAVVASSCSTFDPPAATIGGDELDADTAQESIEAFETLQEEVLSNVGVEAVEGTATAATAGRLWLGYMIRRRLNEQTLTRLGGQITDEDRNFAQDQINGDAQAADFPPAVQEEVIGTIAVSQAINRVATAPTAEALQATYNDVPAGTGAMCVRHILVATRDEAEQIVDELAAGGDFATLAASRSLDTLSAADGGQLTVDGSSCTALSQMVGQFDPNFLEGAAMALPGSPTLVQSKSGWHVVLARPYEEIADSLATAVGAAPGLAATYADYFTTNVSVSSWYGQWRPGAVSVLART